MPIKTNQKNSVNSVNNKTGDIVLNASDVGALAQDADIITSINGKSGDVELTAADIGAVDEKNTFGIEELDRIFNTVFN